MKTLFEVALILSVVWAILYYPYWHLLRPVILLRLRYRIFAARDRLRMLVVSKSIGEKTQAYPMIEQRCHACLSVMEGVDFLELFKAKPSAEEKLRVKQDFEIIEQSGQEIRAIHIEVLHSVIGGILLNSPGLLIPAAIVLIFQFWFGKFKNLIARTQMGVWGATYAYT